MDETQSLIQWCAEFLPLDVVPAADLQLHPISGDAGFRSYYRLNTSPTVVAVVAPPDKEDVPGFVDKALFFAEGGIHVPAVFAVDYQSGYMLLEDLGDQLLLPALTSSTVALHYDTAQSVLLDIQQLQPGPGFDAYSRAKLLEELRLFPEWFVSGLLGIEINSDQHGMLDQVFNGLLDSALEQPTVIVHRDYHARNLMLQPDNTLGVIDFQDAVVGPVTYDLVSLFRDCYIRWPEQQVYQMALAYYRRARDVNIVTQADEQHFLRWFDLMGVQRHLKVLGIFARLWLRDGKQAYLSDLPLVIRYVLEQTGKYPSLGSLHSWFLETLLPAAETHTWYRPWESAGETP